MKHTPEPWKVAEFGPCRLDTAHFIRPVIGGKTEIGATVIATSKVDARRIVACVNACQHISTESLESGLQQNLVMEAHIVKEQRDDLLRKLESLCPTYETVPIKDFGQNKSMWQLVSPEANPYLRGLDLVKKNHGTSGQGALAKCILSLYNSEFYWFPIGDILAPLDTHYTEIVLAMVNEYALHGETAELRQAGEYCYKNFPGLVEMAEAMSNARCEVRRRWEQEREEENRRLHPEEYQ